MEKKYYVYILTNKSNTLYTGITSCITQRINAHKQKLVDGFTKKYNIDKLVYIEEYRDVHNAIAREKQIKSWSRKKKIGLIKQQNPDYKEIIV